MNIINALNGTVTFINKIFAALSAICLFILTAMIALSVVTRYFFNAPIIGVDEISGYLNVAIGFLAIAYALQAGKHVRVDVVTSRLSLKVNKILELVTYLFSLLLIGQLIRTAWYTWFILFNSNTRAQTYLETRLAIPYGIMLMGWIVFFLTLLVGLLQYLANYRSGTAALWKEKTELEQIKEISKDITMSS